MTGLAAGLVLAKGAPTLSPWWVLGWYYLEPVLIQAWHQVVPVCLLLVAAQCWRGQEQDGAL